MWIPFLSKSSGSSSSSNSGRSKVKLILGITATTITTAAFIISLLCLFAGHTPGMMEDMAILTLNTSHLGDNAVQAIDTAVKDGPTVTTVNNAYTAFVHSMNVSDFMSYHALAVCQGMYVTSDGTKITAGDVTQVGISDVKKQVTSCTSSSFMIPVAVGYILSIILIFATMSMGIFGLVMTFFAKYGFYASIGAFVVSLLASGIAHAIAHGGSHVLNLLGAYVDIEGEIGSKFLGLSWVTTIMLAVGAALYWMLWVKKGKEGTKR
jgi:hypothetical protein